MKAYLSQSDNHQIIFLKFEKDADPPEHSHEAQWEYVLNGKVDLYINDMKHTYTKGNNFFIEGSYWESKFTKIQAFFYYKAVFGFVNR